MAAEGDVEELPNSWSRDLLRRFGGETPAEAGVGGGSAAGEVELSLGLSLGGRFGAEPKDKRLGLGLGLVRSSSIAGLSMFPMEQRDEAAGQLMRTCSLPVETEEERRRRKEMQSLKRMEAKRKRSEKRAALAAKERKDEILPEDLGAAKAAAAPPKWAAGNGGRGAAGVSIASQGSSSSSVSDFESKGGIQGNDLSNPGNSFEVGSPSTKSSLSDQTNQKAPAIPRISPPPKPVNTSRDEDEPSRKKICTSSPTLNGATKEAERNMMAEMPCVSTRFEGPDGRRVEGFLYKYKKGEDVRIVCVCHGSFLTPAEFVKHAGGGDVANPLRHIVVSQTSSAF